MIQVFAILPSRSSPRLCESGDDPQVAGIFFVWSRAMVAVSKIAVFDFEGPWPAPPAASHGFLVFELYGFRPQNLPSRQIRLRDLVDFQAESVMGGTRVAKNGRWTQRQNARNVHSGPTIQKIKHNPQDLSGRAVDSVLRAGARFGTRNVIDSFRASAGVGASGG